MNEKYKALFQPIEIGGCKIKNRFVMAPMGPMGLGDVSGGFNQRGIDYYVERAKGGTGLITTGVCFVDRSFEEMAMPSCPNVNYNPIHFTRTAREMTERIHAFRAKIFIQLSGGFGRVIPPFAIKSGVTVAPSPVMNRWQDVMCRELTVDEIHQLVKNFGKAAATCKQAGFDGIQIHAVHEGYLIDQFALSLFNQRQDEYGGSLENRLRLAREIVQEIKRQCGDDFPVTLRFSPKSFIKGLRDGALPGEEFEEKGRDLEEGKEAAKLLVSYGYDALDVDVGSYDSWWWNHPPMYQEKGLYREYAKIMKETVDVPIICAGRMDDPDMAKAAVEEGMTDMIGLGRPLLADPDYVKKLRAGKAEEIRPCISCQEGCMGRMQSYMLVNCAVNPQAARERAMALQPVCKPKKVMIVGGGVAGCEAARVLALRGHKPELYEASGRLGGNLIPGGAPKFKEDDLALARWYEHMLKKLEVTVHLNTPVTKEQIVTADADVVIIATGSTPKRLHFTDEEHVFTADQVLTGQKDAGDHPVVIGGGLVGCETALWLAQEGHDVSIVEAMDRLLAVNAPICSANKEMLEQLIPFNGIETYVNATASDFADGTLTVATPSGEKRIPCSSLILAIGYKERNDLFEDVEDELDEVYLLGDANKVANIMYAIWDAYEVANGI